MPKSTGVEITEENCNIRVRCTSVVSRKQDPNVAAFTIGKIYPCRTDVDEYWYVRSDEGSLIFINSTNPNRPYDREYFDAHWEVVDDTPEFDRLKNAFDKSMAVF